MNLLDLIPGLKKKATTNGGEWSGPCFACGGRDRFRVWPSSGATGRYWCRGCGRSGDAITILRERDGLTFKEACERLGVRPSLTRGSGHGSGPTTTPETWTPRAATPPADAWTDRAGAFLRVCQRNLAGPAGSSCRAFLAGRGLTPETIEGAGLGWNIRDAWESREAWGLEPEVKEDGRPRRFWLPAGLVIPCYVNGRLVRLRIRRPEPGEGPRYVVIPGSGSSPLVLGAGPVWIIIESELDAFLLNQEAGNLCGVISLGSAQARPDGDTHQILRATGLILVSLDSDAAGAREAWKWWAKQYPTARRWPVPIGKDPTEAKQAGLDLRAWILAGLPDSEPSTPAEPANTTGTAPAQETAKQEPPGATNGGGEYQSKAERGNIEYRPFPESWRGLDEETIERLCIVTVEGGMSDAEAERRVLH
jgi:DNA primase